MPHDAFELTRLVERLPLKICAIATWSNNFVLSTLSPKNEAHLLVYSITDHCDADKVFEAKLTKTLKKFTAKPITQLAVVPEHKLFLYLSDGEVQYTHLEHFTAPDSLPRCRGASCFALDWQKLRGVSSFSRELRVCVASRRKLFLYRYTKNTFVLMKSELQMPDVPRAFAWVGDSLVVCIKKDLFLISIDGDSKELFSIGTNRTDPCLLPLMNGDILILKDDMQVSLDQNAKPTQTQPVRWSEMPSAIEHVHPYVIAVLPRGIEVRALEQKVLVQTLTTPEAIRFICTDRWTLVASSTQVYMLDAKQYESQVQQLVHAKHFDLALQISELIEDSPEQKRLRHNNILRRWAFHQFTQHKFEDALKNYLIIQEDPVNVIGLYPHLLPSDLRNSLSKGQPTKPPTLSGRELEQAMKFLITYLTQLRYQEQQKAQRHQKREQQLSGESLKVLTERLKLIDTTLLKCYVKTNNTTLIGSLVRLPDNHLHLPESERILKSEEKFQELVDLYCTKGQHDKALKLLAQLSKGPSTSSLHGMQPTVHYLQNLGSENITHVLDYSKWVIKEDPEVALKIFTEEMAEVKTLPRAQVLDHLSVHAPDLVMPYLEHIIHHWEDPTPDFHDQLVQIYKQQVEVLLDEYLNKNTNQQQRPRAGEEPGALGKARRKLLEHLAESKHYQPAKHISSFPINDMFEERALLLGNLGRHELALAIYAHVLKEPALAEEYCRKTYSREREENREVYLSLIKMYLSPPDLVSYGIRLPEGSLPEANVEDALKVLTAHHHLVDSTKVLDLLPSSTPLRDICHFLSTVLQEATTHHRKSQVLRSLLFAEHLQVHKQRIQTEAPRFAIHESTVCRGCGKRLGNSAFARYPDGAIEHLFCAKERDRKLQGQQEVQSTDADHF